LLIAGLGDGLAIIRSKGDDVATYGGRNGATFSDETKALGAPHRIDDWWITKASPGATKTVVLASDGVADDLDPDRLDDFLEWLTRDLGRLSPVDRWRQLCRELRNWPVPHHIDDKTLAVLHDKAEATK
jgi:hypothetical protein